MSNLISLRNFGYSGFDFATFSLQLREYCYRLIEMVSTGKSEKEIDNEIEMMMNEVITLTADLLTEVDFRAVFCFALGVPYRLPHF